MFVGNDYYIAWVCYLIAVLISAFVWYKLTLWLPRHLRVFSSIFLISLFVAPAKVVDGEIWSAPALILVPFEMLSNNADASFGHLIEPLVNIQLLTVLLFLAYFIVQKFTSSNSSNAPASVTESSDSATQSENSTHDGVSSANSTAEAIGDQLDSPANTDADIAGESFTALVSPKNNDKA